MRFIRKRSSLIVASVATVALATIGGVALADSGTTQISGTMDIPAPQTSTPTPPAGQEGVFWTTHAAIDNFGHSQDFPPTFNGCNDASGNSDTSATGSISIPSDLSSYVDGGDTADIDISAPSGDVCSFTATVENVNNSPSVLIGGVSVTATDSTGRTYGVETSMVSQTAGSGGFFDLEGSWVGLDTITFTLTVPDLPGDSYSLTGGLIVTPVG